MLQRHAFRGAGERGLEYWIGTEDTDTFHRMSQHTVAVRCFFGQVFLKFLRGNMSMSMSKRGELAEFYYVCTVNSITNEHEARK